MQRNLVLICTAAAVVSCHAIAISSAPAAVKSTDRAPQEAFSYVTEGSLFGGCLQAVQSAEAPGVSFTKACADVFGKSGAQAAFVSMDCAELAGRVSEATDEHFLGDGRLMCGRLVRERSVAASRPLASFAPVQGSSMAASFCDVMKIEALAFCATPAAIGTFAVDTPMLPVAAATPSLRAAEVKPVRLVPDVPAEASQMSEAAQTIALGAFPAFAHQVPQALAAGPSGMAKAPMDAKAEQQKDLNSGTIWSNLAALLHRSK